MTTLTEQTARWIEQTLETGEPATLTRLSRQWQLNAADLRRGFQEDLALSPRDYAAGVKAQRLRLALQRSADATQAVFAAGYGSLSRVYEVADLELGMSPASYGLRGRGACIRYTLVDAPLAPSATCGGAPDLRLLLAMTEIGVCFTALAADDAIATAALQAELGLAERIERDDAGLAATVSDVVALIAPTYRQPATLRLPLDIRSTAFQRRVWAGLLAIPAGQCRSYGTLAAQLGNGRAQRAVARACASNPVALLIPCHRVLPQSAAHSGDSGGYRWGVAAKRALLASEGLVLPGMALAVGTGDIRQGG